MTKDGAALVLAVLKTAYPGSYRGMSVQEAKATVTLWAGMFDEPREVVEAAVKMIILDEPEREFAPTIGAVKAKIYKITHPDEMTAQEAWVLVSRAVSRCDMQNPSKEFEKLPPAVQRAVGSANQLREWGMVDEDIFGSVIASNFRKIWDKQQTREREQAAIPVELRQMISDIAQGMAMLPEGENGKDMEA